MNQNHNFHRLSLVAIMLVGIFTLAYAGGDDDEKKGDKKDKRASIIKIDSTDSETDVDVIDQEDTLVFDDWEIPGENFENEENKIGSISQLKGKESISQSFTDAKEKLIDYSFGFKKEYTVTFAVFPNPTTSHINIKAAVEADAIRVTDIAGREYISSGFTNQIDVLNLPSGTYFIQLIYSDHVESRKFIKS